MKLNLTQKLLITAIILLVILVIGVYFLLLNGLPNSDGNIVVQLG